MGGGGGPTLPLRRLVDAPAPLSAASVAARGAQAAAAASAAAPYVMDEADLAAMEQLAGEDDDDVEGGGGGSSAAAAQRAPPARAPQPSPHRADVDYPGDPVLRPELQELVGRAARVLDQRFGHKAFRGRQRAIIAAAFAGDDVFVLMPTGGGKSLW